MRDPALAANLPARRALARSGRRRGAPAAARARPPRSMWKGSSRSLGRTLVLENSKFLLFAADARLHREPLLERRRQPDYIAALAAVRDPPAGRASGRPRRARRCARATPSCAPGSDAQAEAEGRPRDAGAAGAGWTEAARR